MSRLTSISRARLSAGPSFNDVFSPGLGNGRQLFDQLLDDVALTRRGDTVRLSTYSGLAKAVVDALARAHNRGVNVRVAIDNDSRSNRQVRRLGGILGHAVAARSCLTVVSGTGRAGWGTTMHAKMWLVDDAGDGRPMSRVTSSNLASSHTTTLGNNSFAIRRVDVHTWLSRVHEQLMADQPVGQPWTHARFGRYELQMHPLAKPGEDPGPRDIALERLRQVHGHKGVIVGVTMHGWSGDRGLEFVDELARISKQGGKVRVNAGMHIGAQVERQLGAFADYQTCVRKAPRRAAPHDKSIFVVDGPRSFVVTGSCNIGDDPVFKSDELTLIVTGPNPAARYLLAFNATRAALGR